jgi:tripartite-type tricarboxylate transporter receptor subunit TctC
MRNGFTIVAGCLALGVTSAHAQSYPSRSVRFVVPYPAGGAVDIVTHAVTRRLSQIWGQPVMIENKAGGGTQIGAEAVAKNIRVD